MTPALRPVSFRKGREYKPRLSPVRVPGAPLHPRYWTKAEHAIILKYYPDGGVAPCLAHLPGRGPSGVYQQAWILGLSTKKGVRLEVPPGFDDALRAFYQNGDGKKRGECNAFADKWKMPRWWVTKRAMRFELVLPHRKEPNWTAAENELMKHAPLHDLDKSAKIFREHGFHRSATAIQARAKRLNISRRFREAMSATMVSKILGVDNKTIIREIIQGRLQAGRRKTKRLPQQGGDWWTVTSAQLRTYILANLEYVDLRKVDKFAFV